MLAIADYAVVLLMLAVSASVGLYFRFTGGKQKTTLEFLMAGKNTHIVPVAFSLMATYMSAISVLGVPSETYLYGTQFFLWVVGLSLGSLVACYGFVPVFLDMDVSTAYEYLELRFGKSIRTIAALLFTIQMMFYMAVVLYAPSLALNAVTGLSTWTSVISLAIVCTFYCSLGGLKAVIWTDVFQSFLMYTTIIAVVVKGTIDVGGLGEVVRIANEGGRLIFFNTSQSLTERYTLWNTLFWSFLFGIHTFGTNQAQIQRLLSVGTVKKSQHAILCSLPLILIFNIFTFSDGVVIYANYHDCDPLLDNSIRLQSPDQLMPFAIIKMFSHIPGFPGLCIAGVFSASLSTISSAVNSLTAVTMEDFIRPYCYCQNLTESWAAFMAKIIAVGYGGLCLFLTFIVANFRGVLEASNVLFGMVGGPVFGVYFLGMFSKTANEKGTFFGLLVGFVINALLGFGAYVYQVKTEALPQSVAGCPALNTTFNITGLYLQDDVNRNFTENESQTQNKLQEEGYVFPGYQMSFMWFPIIGAIVVILVGYIASIIASFHTETKEFDASYFSPFVRKWYFKDVKTEDNRKVCKNEIFEKH